MKFLVTGYKGQLGYDIVRELKKRGYNKNLFSIDIFGYRDKYDINIDLQYGDYLMSKFLDGVYVCEVECKTQNRVISLLSKY